MDDISTLILWFVQRNGSPTAYGVHHYVTHTETNELLLTTDEINDKLKTLVDSGHLQWHNDKRPKLYTITEKGKKALSKWTPTKAGA